jgi:hypothetical protein
MRRVMPELAVPILAVILLLVGLPKPRAQAIDWDSPAARHELQSFKQFLANHPWIANKLRENPSLANDKGFQHHSPELPQFLNAHPFVQSNFKIDANGVMSRVQQSDLGSPNNHLNYQEMRNFKHFLSIHPWIADKLRQKPSLANDKGFLNGAHELPEFLNAHPYVQAQIRADASGVMRRVQELPPDEPRPGAHSSDYEALKLFMDNHKWIAEKLKDDPSRATNKDFLKDSRELRQFLEAHPYLQEQFKQDARGTLDLALQPQAGGEYF